MRETIFCHGTNILTRDFNSIKYEVQASDESRFFCIESHENGTSSIFVYHVSEDDVDVVRSVTREDFKELSYIRKEVSSWHHSKWIIESILRAIDEEIEKCE